MSGAKNPLQQRVTTFRLIRSDFFSTSKGNRIPYEYNKLGPRNEKYKINKLPCVEKEKLILRIRLKSRIS
jgi:hypothetical protein